MPRTGYLIAVVTAVISAVVFPWPATADHVAGEEPYFTCRASVARATLLDEQLIPTIEPLAANSNREECAEDTAGAPTIALPPPANPPPPTPATPVVSAGLVQASTEILCADDDPDPAVDPADNDACDAGRRSFEQQVLSRADAADVRINLGAAEGVPAGIEIIAQAANTTARAQCGPGNVPVLSSTSNVLNIVVRIGGAEIPIQIPEANEEAVIDLGIARLTLNELIVTPEDQQPNEAGDFVFPDDATEGRITRRAIHLEVPGGSEPERGSIADVVVAESIADFHGDVCPEGRIVIKKETVPDQDPNTTTFPFTSPTLTPTSFNLTDDGEQVFDEVQPGTHAVTETAAPGQYSLAAINCAENRTENTTTAVGTRTATVNVGPGETVTCTFINAVCPPGSVLNPSGECVILQIRCPEGSTLNNMGQCIINTTQCPPGSTRPDPNGPCIVTNITCPPGSTGPNQQGQCILNTTTCPPGTTGPSGGPCVVTNITCPPGSTGPNQQGQCVNNTINCPPGSTLVAGECVVSRPDCPPGTSRNAQGQCIISSVQCPAGTTFNPVTLGCTEAPRGGTLVPLNNPQLQNFLRGSPCLGQGFGPLVGIFGTNGPDRITGTNVSDRIFALGGDDRVSGGRGDDCVEGGTGNDVLDGSNGNDFLLGGTGNDQVNGGPGRDRFSGGSGRDVMSGGSGNDRMSGAGGRDRLNGGYGNDNLVGGAGNDGIHTGNGRDRVNAGPGNDVINAATRGPAAFVNCGAGSKDRVRINRNEVRRTRNCEFVDVPRRIRSNNRPQSPR